MWNWIRLIFFNYGKGRVPVRIFYRWRICISDHKVWIRICNHEKRSCPVNNMRLFLIFLIAQDPQQGVNEDLPVSIIIAF